MEGAWRRVNDSAGARRGREVARTACGSVFFGASHAGTARGRPCGRTFGRQLAAASRRFGLGTGPRDVARRAKLDELKSSREKGLAEKSHLPAEGAPRGLRGAGRAYRGSAMARTLRKSGNACISRRMVADGTGWWIETESPSRAARVAKNIRASTGPGCCAHTAGRACTRRVPWRLCDSPG